MGNGVIIICPEGHIDEGKLWQILKQPEVKGYIKAGMTTNLIKHIVKNKSKRLKEGERFIRELEGDRPCRKQQ